MTQISFRSVQEQDVDELLPIFNHYVSETVINFRFELFTKQDLLDSIREHRMDNMPFVAATNSSGKILGYTSTTGYRAGKRGYWHTLELSLFCHPEHTGQGVGSKLVEFLLAIMRDPQGHREFLPNADEFRQVRHLMAGMAVEINGPRKGLALKDFYERCGFSQAAFMPKIGYKFDRWWGFISF